MKERCNSSALAMELCFSCTNPSKCTNVPFLNLKCNFFKYIYAYHYFCIQKCLFSCLSRIRNCIFQNRLYTAHNLEEQFDKIFLAPWAVLLAPGSSAMGYMSRFDHAHHNKFSYDDRMKYSKLSFGLYFERNSGDHTPIIGVWSPEFLKNKQSDSKEKIKINFWSQMFQNKYEFNIISKWAARQTCPQKYWQALGLSVKILQTNTSNYFLCHWQDLC